METKIPQTNPNFPPKHRYSVSFRRMVSHDSLKLRRSSKISKKALYSAQEVKPVVVLFKNEPITLSLIQSINLLKEIKSKKNKQQSFYEDESNPKYIIKNIVNKIKSHKGLYNFFSYYKVLEDKFLYKLAPLIKFNQSEKNNYIWEEGDNSDRIYFLLKGKLSFKKNAGSILEKEKYTLDENNAFGLLDIIYERKRKFSCVSLTECCYLSFDKDFYKKNMEEKVNKIETEKKSFLTKFFNSYITIPQTKLERFISNYVEILFFGKNEIIYSEGDKNKCLYLIFIGEANLVKNINKGEFFILSKLNQSID